MIDIEARVRALMIAQPELTAAFGQRIYAARSLPPGYVVGQGPALLFGVRGGRQGYHSQLYQSSIQCRVYAETEAKARAGAVALYDALNDTQARGFAYIRMEEGTLPVLLNEPDTNWPYILCYYTFQVQNL